MDSCHTPSTACANRSPCDEGFGVCRASCFHLEREVKEGCGGPDCKCCTSRKADCSASAECPGICMDSRMCINPLSNFSCSGAGCVCCDKCNDHPLCNGGNGVCRDKCHILEHETVGDCGYTGCKCCTPLMTSCPHSDRCPGICMDNKFCTNPLKFDSCAGSDCVCCDKCSLKPFCDEGFGMCRKECYSTERELDKGCHDHDCKCCTPREATCPSSAKCSGICIDARKCVYPVANNFCPGKSCVCCDRCYEQHFCDDGYGKCREWCHSEEREMEGGCAGAGCKCCTLREATCKDSSKCPGICIDSRKCLNPLNAFSCSGNDCICCDKCNAHPFCDGGNGVCRDTCINNERVVEGGCGNTGCICCSHREAVCYDSNKCPGICIDAKLCSYPLKDYTCSGEYCVCCDRCKSESFCDDGFGVCRDSCLRSELEVGVCGGSGCVCCTSRLVTCTNNTFCSGICMDKRLCINPIHDNECSGSDCICCDKCNAHHFCDEGRGICRESCSHNEHEMKEECGNTGCKCCSNRHSECDDHHNKCPGICMDKRLCHNPITKYECQGPNCICCHKCNAKPFCDEGYGVCRESCDIKEREIRGHCGHVDCKCCTTRLANCTTPKHSSGICVDYRMCSNPKEHQCCTEPDCVCCDKCNAQPFCDDGHGVCREVCEITERELHKGCSKTGCKCCTTRLAKCGETSNCPGDCQDKRICATSAGNYSCGSEDCICCDTCSVTQPSCDDDYGTCRLSCRSSEREIVGGCTNSGCKCCSLRITPCTSSYKCHRRGICMDSRQCPFALSLEKITFGICDTGCVCCDFASVIQPVCGTPRVTGVCTSYECPSTTLVLKGVCSFGVCCIPKS
ncbi:tenascin-like [Cherax quadricarinatus]|uniref:tenascin-like n=1 Tax=Cherax quadricarinatus TaxID=27406 RepID=UPI00387ECB08